ncbi:MAG TPA: serine/threonine-protein kinase [Polyangiaceae bacterium]
MADDSNEGELRRKNAALDQQVKLLVKTEKRLYVAQRTIEKQLGRIEVLNRFALQAGSAGRRSDIVRLTIRMILDVLRIDQVAFVLADRTSEAWSATEQGSARGFEAQGKGPPLPSPLGGALPDKPVILAAGSPPPGPVTEWLVGAGAAIFDAPGEPEPPPLQIVLPLWRRNREPLGAIVLRTLDVAVTLQEELPGTADIPFFELLRAHVETALDSVILYEELSAFAAGLEARVAERTTELEKLVADLREVNLQLTASNNRADRIFSALADALPGTVIEGKYRLHERIGVGGSGVVFRGEHLGLGRPIAVKIFKPWPGNDSAEALERFRIEGKLAARIEHPNAVQIFDFGISGEGLAYLVMQLLEGRPLSEELNDEPVPGLDRVLRIVDAVASVLETAHQLGVVHRDIKPENVFLHASPDGEVVKVVDFGIAKVMDGARAAEVSGITTAGTMIGTPAYMAPERFDAESTDVGPPSDVYALGVLAYRLLTGRLPFRGTFAEVAMSHLSVTAPAPSSCRADLPRAADTAILRALEKDPEHRPGAEAFARELRAAFGRTASSAAPPGLKKVAGE